jgi:NAD(P)H-dependent FMN reductase
LFLRVWQSLFIRFQTILKIGCSFKKHTQNRFLMNIAVISASTRINRKSHRVALGLVKKIDETGDHFIEILDLAEYQFPIMEETLKSLPNPPEGLVSFSKAIKKADAVIFVSPEYNGSYTSALKNALDYLSENEFTQKVVGVASVTEGPLGGMRAAQAMQQLVLGVGGYAIPQMLLVGNVSTRFDETGNLIDPTFEKKMQAFLNGFLWLSTAIVDKKNVLVS